MRGQSRRQVLAKRFSVGGRPHGGVSDQSAASRIVLAGDHGCGRHRRVRGEYRLDLAEFDAEPADLHLVVGAAQVLEYPGSLA